MGTRGAGMAPYAGRSGGAGRGGEAQGFEGFRGTNQGGEHGSSMAHSARAAPAGPRRSGHTLAPPSSPNRVGDPLRQGRYSLLPLPSLSPNAGRHPPTRGTPIMRVAKPL